jgi:hypothetical protein
MATMCPVPGRIGRLDSRVFRRGRTAEDIFRAYPSIGSPAKVYGVITFILGHPQEIEEYLRDEERASSDFDTSHSLPSEILAPFQRVRDGKEVKSA